MHSMLSKLSCAIINPIVQTQSYLSRMPKDGTNILVCADQTVYLQCVKIKTSTGEHICAISTGLTSDIDERNLKIYGLTSCRSEYGNAFLILTNAISDDGYSSAKRELLRSKEAATYTIRRTENAYEFTASQKQIEHVSSEEFDRLLELFFEDSVISTEEHPVYKTLISDDKSKTISTHDLPITVMPNIACRDNALDIDFSDIDIISI